MVERGLEENSEDMSMFVSRLCPWRSDVFLKNPGSAKPVEDHSLSLGSTMLEFSAFKRVSNPESIL